MVKAPMLSTLVLGNRSYCSYGLPPKINIDQVVVPSLHGFSSYGLPLKINIDHTVVNLLYQRIAI